MKKITDMDIIAHRGGNNPFMENTLESFLYAVKLGFKAIEMDLRYSYVFKFFFLEHDFIYHPRFRKNRADNIFPHIPEDITLFVEMKTNALFSNILARAYVKLFDKHLKNRRSFSISFNPVILYRIKKIRPQIQTGFICGSRFLFLIFQYLVRPLLLKPDIIVLNRRLLNRRNVRYAKKHGIRIYSYVINRNEDRHKALDLDIDGIVTDYPL